MLSANLTTLPLLLQNSAVHYSDRLALSTLDRRRINYTQLLDMARRISYFLYNEGLRKGDKVAIISANTPNWAISYFGITYAGMVVVPILIDFSVYEMNNILKHSDAKALFITSKLYQRMEESLVFDGIVVFTEHLEEQFHIPHLNSNILEYTSNDGFNNYKPEEVIPDDVANIIYTSGTTGRSKGVMLTHKNITFVAEKVLLIQDVKRRDIFLSILPLSHVYENILGLVLPIRQGASVHYLHKIPTPSVLFPALKKVRPTMMLTVPLIIEKIFYTGILPNMNKTKIMRGLYQVRPIQFFMNRHGGKALKKAFGGRLHFFGIGGAPLDPYVEKFLRDAKFPYSCGYGLTETTSLIFGSRVGHVKYGSVGIPVEGVQFEIVNPNMETHDGEIRVKGDCVMKGYYKNTELTDIVLSKDGWLNTGDIGIICKGNLYIKGRTKNMILGPSGENIYPEEIEAVLNTMEGVEESLVLQTKGKLIARVYLNEETLSCKYDFFKKSAMELQSEMQHKIQYYLTELKKKVNDQLGKYQHISSVEKVDTPFEKTPTKKIKRYLYKD